MKTFTNNAIDAASLIAIVTLLISLNNFVTTFDVELLTVRQSSYFSIAAVAFVNSAINASSLIAVVACLADFSDVVSTKEDAM